MKTAIIVLSIMAIALAVPGLAFDGERKGFILGGGIGPAFTSFHEEGKYEFYSPYGEYETDHSGIGLQYSVRAGYAPIDRLAFYAFGKDISFEYKGAVHHGDVELFEDSQIYTTGFLGFGTMYFHKTAYPSFYTKGEVAYPVTNSSFIQPDFSFSKGGPPGFSFCFGLGYEFARNWCAELDATWAETSGGYWSGYGSHLTYETSSYSIALTVNAFVY